MELSEEKNKIRVLWLCNLMPSFVGDAIGKPATNKEGWIAGMYCEVKNHNDITLAIAYPDREVYSGSTGDYFYYAFREDGNRPEDYESELKKGINDICESFKPDVIHCFGTEYAHTRALLENEKYAGKALIHLQGIMEVCFEKYYTDLPEKVIKHNTFRDIIKKDGIRQQKEKFGIRAKHEAVTISNAKNICGRTEFDREYTKKKNPSAVYYRLNETLRDTFYEGDCWTPQKSTRHRIFVSQGNYPLKGLHTVLEAVGMLKDKYPDISLYVAGDDIVRDNSLKNKIREPEYGRYLKKLIKKYGLEDIVYFLGQKNASEMKEQMMQCNVFVLPSFVENSPNSLGEAMMLGVPSVCTDTCGIPSLADDKTEVLMYEPGDAAGLCKRITDIFEDDSLCMSLSEKAVKRANETHDRLQNYKDALKIYRQIAT